MKNIKNYLPVLALSFIFIVSISISSFYFPIETKSNGLMAFVTFLVGILVIYLYIKQKEDSRINAAKIIIQEIRRAEDILTKYKVQGNFEFTKKIIANNSWGTNIHFFVGDLDPDELDKISNLYSTGEFLDYLIQRISNWKFNHQSEVFEKKLVSKKIRVPLSTTPIFSVDNISITGGVDDKGQQFTEVEVRPLQVEPFWNPLLENIVRNYEFIYHSTIVGKLKEIARIK